MFLREQRDLVNSGRLCKELARLAHQRLGDGAIQVSLTPSFVVERIENSIGAFVFRERIPRDRLILLLGERKCRLQKSLNFRVFFGLGFEMGVESEFGHASKESYAFEISNP